MCTNTENLFETLSDAALDEAVGGGGLLDLLGLPNINLLNGLDLNLFGISKPAAPSFDFFGGLFGTTTKSP
jgi:hypothetical protein